MENGGLWGVPGPRPRRPRHPLGGDSEGNTHGLVGSLRPGLLVNQKLFRKQTAGRRTGAQAGVELAPTNRRYVNITRRITAIEALVKRTFFIPGRISRNQGQKKKGETRWSRVIPSKPEAAPRHGKFNPNRSWRKSATDVDLLAFLRFGLTPVSLPRGWSRGAGWSRGLCVV